MSWQCIQCGTSNWSSKSACRFCSAAWPTPQTAGGKSRAPMVSIPPSVAPHLLHQERSRSPRVARRPKGVIAGGDRPEVKYVRKAAFGFVEILQAYKNLEVGQICEVVGQVRSGKSFKVLSGLYNIKTGLEKNTRLEKEHEGLSWRWTKPPAGDVVHDAAEVDTPNEAAGEQYNEGEDAEVAEGETATIPLPTELLTRVLGPQGSNFLEICRSSGATICLAPVIDEDAGDSFVLEVSGARSNVAAAQASLEELTECA